LRPTPCCPAVKINTSETDFAPIEQLQMMRFKGDKWELFGDIISGRDGKLRPSHGACLSRLRDPVLFD